MKHSFILKNSATRSLIIAGTLILGTVGISHAQTAPTDRAAQGGAHLLAQAGSSAEQPASGWKDPVTGQATAPEGNTAAPAQAALQAAAKLILHQAGQQPGNRHLARASTPLLSRKVFSARSCVSCIGLSRRAGPTATWTKTSRLAVLEVDFVVRGYRRRWRIKEN